MTRSERKKLNLGNTIATVMQLETDNERLKTALARKDAMLRKLADAALRAVNCEYGCGGCFRTCIFDKANTVRDLADAARKEAGK